MGYGIPSINTEKEGKNNSVIKNQNPDVNTLNAGTKQIFDTNKSRIKF